MTTCAKSVESVKRVISRGYGAEKPRGKGAKRIAAQIAQTFPRDNNARFARKVLALFQRVKCFARITRFSRICNDAEAGELLGNPQFTPRSRRVFEGEQKDRASRA